jgi:hypothetical protein
MSEHDPVGGDFDSFSAFCSRPDPIYPVGKNGKFRCPCCLYFTLGSVGGYDICPICFWEDDGTTGEHGFSPNGCSLDEGQKNYKRCGASKDDMLKHCRPPEPDEKDDA